MGWIEELRAALGPERVRTDAGDLRAVARDGSPLVGAPACLAYPEERAHVEAAVRIAAAAGVPVVARGGGTSLAAGAIPPRGALVLAFNRMARLRTLDVEERCALVEPGLDERRARRRGTPPWPALRPRPVVTPGLDDRRERLDQRRRSALPGPRRHDGSRPRPRGRPRRRHAGVARRPGLAGPARPRRRGRGHARDRHRRAGVAAAGARGDGHGRRRVRAARGRRRRRRGDRASRPARGRARVHRQDDARPPRRGRAGRCCPPVSRRP